MAEALINPHILMWARERAGFGVAEIAEKLKIKQEQWLAWERGEKNPSFSKAQEFAQKTHIPFGYLYLNEPPKQEPLLPDLRTIGDKPIGEFSLALEDSIRIAFERRDWYREYNIQNEQPALTWLGSADLQQPQEALAAARTLLNDVISQRPRQFDAYYRTLIEKIENTGVLVMRNSIVGNNTHRPLDREEFRGFAIADDYAPVIFINAADIPQAQIFTLLHEFAHLLVGESGVSDLSPRNSNRIEKFCNTLAAEFLVPSDTFTEQWDQSTDNWLKNLPELAEFFHVSQWVIARRALEHGFITETQYWAHYRKVLEHFKQEKETLRDKPGGPAFNSMIKMRYSAKLAKAVASEALSGRMLLRDAQYLIGIRPSKLKEFARKELGY
ncbi:ImmA/IrrE family metallo-endopeptidase [Pseudomonas sp. C27(2019)]|uniref:XRE family transcriptional regulator n=1 Tax=Pseudomonas sp. C27(2019) TaxID=2604941 RepID=UPI001248C9F0|nr:ImmA/IrrE family metallo-endopeptidase [Pseudomonas sp. C27(2019)]QEY58920.1 ImmA/IrrE family metallo-endopeptidase [Pseudomonas sp. C27(2019)]